MILECQEISTGDRSLMDMGKFVAERYHCRIFKERETMGFRSVTFRRVSLNKAKAHKIRMGKTSHQNMRKIDRISLLL